MAPADWAILAVLAICIFSGLRRGFFVTVCSLLGVVLGLILASHYYPLAAEWFRNLGANSAFSEAFGFITIAVMVMLAAGLCGRLCRTVFSSLGLGWADRLAGGVLGLLKGGMIVTLVVMTIAAFLPHWSVLEESRLANFFLETAHTGSVMTPEQLGARIRAGIRIMEDAQPIWLRPQI